MHVHVVHRDGGVGRDDPVLVSERGGRRDAGHAADNAVGHAEAFFDDGAEVREVFEVAPEGEGFFVGDSGVELGFEGCENVRGVEDVEGDDREGISCRFIAGDDEQDALVREAIEAFFFHRHFVVMRHFIKDGWERLWFRFDSGVSVARFGDLLLYHLYAKMSVAYLGEGRYQRDGSGSTGMLRVPRTLEALVAASLQLSNTMGNGR